VHFVENIFPYSFSLTTASSLSLTSIPTCIQPSSPTPSNHIQIIPTSICQNSNFTSTAFSLPTASYNLSSLMSMPTSPHTSSPPHVLPNFTESSPPSNHDILYTFGSSPSTYVDSSSCLFGSKQQSYPMVTRSKYDIFKPKHLNHQISFI